MNNDRVSRENNNTSVVLYTRVESSGQGVSDLFVANSAQCRYIHSYYCIVIIQNIFFQARASSTNIGQRDAFGPSGGSAVRIMRFVP